MWTISDLASQVASWNSGQQASAINGVFGPVTEKSQSEDSLQVALILHLERRKQSVGLLLNLANMKKLQLAVEPHSCKGMFRKGPFLHGCPYLLRALL